MFRDISATYISDLNDIFTRFGNAGLKLNPKKCSFAKSVCVFLGHDISSEGIKPPPDRIKALEKSHLLKMLSNYGEF